MRTESDLTSCQVQRELCADFAIGKGFQVVEQQFDDEGYSGASLDRPALQELLNQVRCGQIHAVAVQRLDRLSRRVSQCAGILDEFRRTGVEVLIAEIPESAKGASGRLLTNLLSSFAEFERDMTTSRIADTRAGLVARGRRIAGRIPFGYSTDLKTKQLVPVPREAGVVKTMFELVADGVKTSVVEETALLRSWRTRSGKLWTLVKSSTPYRIPSTSAASVHRKAVGRAPTWRSSTKPFSKGAPTLFWRGAPVPCGHVAPTPESTGLSAGFCTAEVMAG